MHETNQEALQGDSSPDVYFLESWPIKRGSMAAFKLWFHRLGSRSAELHLCIVYSDVRDF